MYRIRFPITDVRLLCNDNRISQGIVHVSITHVRHTVERSRLHFLRVFLHESRLPIITPTQFVRMSGDELYDQVSSGDEQDYLDTKRWRASEPPQEVFTESENNREWGYDIIGEEVDENGEVM